MTTPWAALQQVLHHLNCLRTDGMDPGERKFDAYIFPYGVFVCWGVSENEIAALESELQEFEVNSLDEPPFMTEGETVGRGRYLW